MGLFKGIFNLDAKKPETLLRLYVVTAILSIAVILFLTWAGIRHVYSRHTIEDAERDAVNVGNALLEDEKDFLISTAPDGRQFVSVGKERLDAFDRHIRKFLHPFDIVKIKIYDLESRIIYSTDPAIIGKVDAGNRRLKNALLGNNDSKFENKDNMVDVAGERKFDVDIVESYIPVRGEGGEVLGSFEVYMNVTRYRAEIRELLATSVSVLATILLLVFSSSFFLIRRGTIQLKEAHEELLRKEKLGMLGVIAGGMGNELRNPLGVMSNAVYYLKSISADADETVREYLEIIENEIDNSQRIISNLLDFSRGKNPQAKIIHLHVLIHQGLVRCAVPENISVRFELPETLPPVKVDPLQMEQVLQNLITNAVQAMPDGGALHVAARRVKEAEKVGRYEGRKDLLPSQLPTFLPSDQEFIEISIADTGEGIAPENMVKLFQPLFSTRSRGIGLGLAFSRKIIEANGGRIGVESELGKGSTFTVLLPVKEDAVWET